jgi:SPP1 family predicted phage head-tail adaptor
MNHVKTKKITIMKYTVTYNELGEEIKAWLPLPGCENIWAYYRQLSGKEYWTARAVLTTAEEVVFEINYRTGLDTTMRILFRGQYYNITRIDDYEGNKEDIKLYANIVK